MRLDGRRESSNVDDRRRAGGMKTAGGIGIGTIVIALLLKQTLLLRFREMAIAQTPRCFCIHRIRTQSRIWFH